MPEINEEAAKNIQEFFEMYGPKEFVTVYLQQILLEMYRIGVHSSGRSHITELIHQYFFTEDGEVRPPQEIDAFDEQVEERCFELASKIVATLGDSFFAELPTEPKDLDNERIRKLNRKLQRALEKHLGGRWGK